MFSETISAPESLFTDVAWKDNSFQMIGFNVIFDVIISPLLSTHFAKISKSTPIAQVVMAFLHHRFHPFLKLYKITEKFPGTARLELTGSASSWFLPCLA